MMDREAWSANREFTTARGLGMYSPRGQEVLRLAGMSLASLSNIPSQLSSLDVSQAVSYISQYLDSSNTGDSAQTGVPVSGPHNFSDYLQQMKTWELVMGETDPFSSDTPQSSNTSPLRLVQSTRKRDSEPGALDVRSVPSIFFQEAFDVEDSATFHAACPVGDLNEAERIQTLEGHLDKVEGALEAEVTARAAELVDVSLDISSVGRAVSGVHKHTIAIREQVAKSADDKLWELETLQTLKVRKARWTAMQQTISQAIEIRQTLASVENVMDVSDWLTAADTIALTECLHDKAQAARSLDCLANVPTRLNELRETLQKNLMTALAGAAEFKGMEELTVSCCQELEVASSLEDFSFTGELTSHFTDGGEGGMGLPPQPGPDGTLPAIWELQQAALWPSLMAAQRTGSLKSCLSSFADAAVAATRSAVGAHLHACVHALLRSERKGAKDSTGVPPTLNAPLEDLLQWLRPIAFAVLLQSLQLLLRVLHWFYSGCAVLMDACLSTVDATAAERELCQDCNAKTLQRVMDAFQQRWAWLLTAAYASELEQYSKGGHNEAAPVTLNQFLTVTEMSKEVEAVCSSAGNSASAVLHALKALGKHLLKGHASGLQGQLELVLNAEPWTVCTVDPTVQHFVDDLLNPTPSSSNLSRRSSLKWEASNNGKLPTPSTSGARSSNGASNGASSCSQSLTSSAAPSARTTAESVQGAQGGASPQGVSPRVTASSVGQDSVASVASKVSDVSIPEEGVTAASLMSALDSAASKNAAAERLQASLRSVGDSQGDTAVLATTSSSTATRSAQITSSESLKEPPSVSGETPDGEAGGAPNGAQGGQRVAPPALDVEAATAIVIGEERYVIVSSVALLLQHLDALLAFGHVSLSLRYEMGSRIAELVRVFNVRSSELLLGAGAIVSAGLRSITARHMAVCSQCLLLLEVLLPRLRYVALGGLPAVQVAALASLFEAITEGVAQHRQQIHSKLVNIMRERLSTSLKFLSATATSWAAYNAENTPLYGTATPRTAASPDGKSKPGELTRQDSVQPAKPKTVAKMMLQIARQVTTLHEALAPVMSRSQQAEIGMRVRRMYSEAVARALRSLQPSGESWLQAAEHDVMIVIQALKLLPGKTDVHGLESVGEYLQQVQDLLADTKKASEAATSSAATDGNSTAADDVAGGDEQSTSVTDGAVATLDSNKQDMKDADEVSGTHKPETVNSTALDQNAGPEPGIEKETGETSTSELADGQQQDALVQGHVEIRE